MCADPAGEAGGELEIVAVVLLVLITVVHVSGSLVAALGRPTAGLALLAAAGGMVLAVGVGAFVAWPTRCDYDRLIEYGTVNLRIEAPLDMRESGPAVWFNMSWSCHSTTPQG
jgi:hypothetical protein